jgi:phosphopantetheinyl transferase
MTRIPLASHALRLVRDAMRRPSLDAAASLDFNVSHSGAHGLIALSTRRRVGVDIEQCRADLDWRSLASLTLAGSEVAWLGKAPAGERLAHFYDACVTKEALLKTSGRGHRPRPAAPDDPAARRRAGVLARSAAGRGVRPGGNVARGACGLCRVRRVVDA